MGVPNRRWCFDSQNFPASAGISAIKGQVGYLHVPVDGVDVPPGISVVGSLARSGGLSAETRWSGR